MCFSAFICGTQITNDDYEEYATALALQGLNEKPAVGQWLKIRSIGPSVNTTIALSESCTM